ncbi:MAG TPA: hypothetical protein VMT20_24240 [Terriglobia bacterium]|nr:hypothetical protein [Terriglobia bacterium]
MTNAQLYFAIGLPCITVMTVLVVSLVQISAIRDDIRSLVGKLDLLTGKVAGIDTRLAVLEERSK